MENEGSTGALELSTLSSQDHALTLDPSSLSETYVSGPSQSTASVSTKPDAIEHTEPHIVTYESYSYAHPNRFRSTEDIIPRGRHPSDGTEPCGDNMSLKTRLMHRRHRMQFLEFAAYAIDSVYDEVEKIIILDIIFLLFSVITFGIGIGHVGECRASPTIPVMMGVCGGMDAAFNSLGVAARFVRGRRNCRQAISDTVRAGRAVFFFVHLYSVGVVYNCWPPGEDKDSFNYCHPTVFWVAFAFFHLTSLTSLAVLTGMVAAVLCYFV